MIKKYWKIECSEGLSQIFEAKVSTEHLSEKRLKDFIQTLIAKYILTPQEVLEEYKSVPFRKRNKYVHITRTNDKYFGKTTINYMADSVGISIVAYLIEELNE